jgi:ribosomal protein L33
MGCNNYWSRRNNVALDNTDRLMVNKYWDNLADYFAGKSFNGLAVVDTSGSMTGSNADAPINVAISLGLYCAEKAKGPFAGHYVSFSSRPQLIKTEGVDFVDKVYRIYKTNLCENTNLEATFDMLLNTAIANRCTQDDLPKSIIVISDMQIDMGSSDCRPQGWGYYGGDRASITRNNVRTMMEKMRLKWAAAGYVLPNLVYWNVNASKDTILDDGANVSYVSGFSPSVFEQIMTGKVGYDLMMDKLNSKRYEVIG